MSDCSAPEILEAYNAVRADADETNWLLITYEEGSNNKKWCLHGKGTGGLEELRSNITPDFIGFGYVRVISGDEMSKRPKFVFIKYISKGLKMTVKALMNVHRGDVEKVFNQSNVTMEVETVDELSDEEVLTRVKRAGGAHYTRED
ncbi:cofilin/tropomyosin-type actin-binding protein [Tritrichomonas foetus]|uniref:Cofilin/tropomyosin-type actin-binding protein n=1 Tax=Tritrichomonas foetus TaxID=1144522 RepID=A0A1J4L1W5_9EUKA|nr:cofilin/tropomyosin-type actin-binding protein [Tritrichomonas foetus]OHT17506.1 cofilin/tropomyosin-type actin-binding protein [Tritrichomonas foetus]|eukprot:OHT17505.1 cofilin/tropomyosin-type actin-binding protein [Tritrichomonas foetus]